MCGAVFRNKDKICVQLNLTGQRMKVVVLLSLATVVYSRCCLPDAFQMSFLGSQTILEAKPQMKSTIVLLRQDNWLDVTTQQQRMATITVSNGVIFNETIIQDRWKGLTYEINSHGGNTTCRKYKDKPKIRKICLSGVKFTDTTFIGMGSTTMKVDHYSFDRNMGHLTLMHDACVPLELLEYSNYSSKGSAVIGGVYVDFVPKILNRGIFVPPSNCTFKNREKTELFEGALMRTMTLPTWNFLSYNLRIRL